MEDKKCEFCGTNYNINIFYKNLDSRDQSEKNIIVCCEKCKNLFEKKISINAVQVCKNLGLMVDKKANWYYDSNTVRQELDSVKSLKDENSRIKKDLLILQDKLGQLVNKGYDREILLKPNEILIDFDFKRSLYCRDCGMKIELFKRDGRYIGSCCGHIYTSRIDRLIFEVL